METPVHTLRNGSARSDHSSLLGVHRDRPGQSADEQRILEDGKRLARGFRRTADVVPLISINLGYFDTAFP
jgi:hypothetical protein